MRKMPRVKTSLLLAYFLTSSLLWAEKLVLVAGGGSAAADAPAKECRLREPFGLEFGPGGEMVIVEMVSGNRVLKVDQSGRLTVLAGTGQKGYAGDGGAATAATFNGIHNLVVLANGDLLLADSFNDVVRRVEAKTGLISTAVGSGQKQIVGETGPGRETGFSTLIQIALEPDGQRLLITDIGNRRIRRMDLGSGIVTTVAGNGQKGVPTDGAEATQGPLVDPRAAISDGAGGIYILERNGNALRHVDAKGKIKTVVGTGEAGYSGDNGPALQATMRGPKHLCLDRDQSVLIADAENHVIRRYSPKSGLITPVAGTGKAGTGEPGLDPKQTALKRPHGVTIGPDGLLYITDSYNDRILKLVP